MEEWKNVIGYEGLYEVSNMGNVRNVRRNTLLKLSKNKYGYIRVFLYKNGISTGFQVHRLVAQAFLPNPDNLPQVNHKDEDKSNNRVDNLEWCSQLYNNIYGSRMERQVNTRKLKNEHPELFKTEDKVKVERKKLTEEDKKEYQREYYKLHYEEHRIWMKERGNELRRKRRSENREEENRKQREYRRMKKLKKS